MLNAHMVDKSFRWPWTKHFPLYNNTLIFFSRDASVVVKRPGAWGLARCVSSLSACASIASIILTLALELPRQKNLREPGVNTREVIDETYDWLICCVIFSSHPPH